MTQLTPARFRAIIDAYGAEPRRWPDAERAAALAYLEANPQEAWLDEARGLDAMLDLLAEPVSAELVEDLHYRAMARFTLPQSTRPRAAPVIWAGLGLAACLAGAVLGVNLSMKSLDDMRAQTVLEQTAMIDTE